MTINENLYLNTNGIRIAKDKEYLSSLKEAGATTIYLSFEVEIDDFKSGRKILEALGYTVTALYEKYRETYQIDHNQVMLDELPFGCFVEIEGPSIESIRHLSDQLRLPWERRVQASYLELFDRIRDPLNLEFEEVTFDKLEGLAPVDPELLGVGLVD